MQSKAAVDRHRARTTLIIGGLITLVLLCWMLLVPPGAQPDEPSHLVRSGALVRGVDPVGHNSYAVPGRYLVPEPACYAFEPKEAASCSPLPDIPDGDIELPTKAEGYPWGAHAAFGVASLLPGLTPLWWARLAAVAIGVVFLTGAVSLAQRSRSISVGSLLLGLTPMAWAIIPAVNPSSIAVAGGAGLWIGLLLVMPGRDLSQGHRWLIAASWVATSIPRRDGLVWACVIAIIALILTGNELASVVRRLGMAANAVVLASIGMMVVWGFTDGARVSKLVVLAPPAVLLVDRLHAWWRDRPATARAATVVGACLVAAPAWVLLVSTRPGGLSREVLSRVIGQTDDNLVEAIGVLGWLDARIPALAVFAWLVILGVLAGGAWLANRRALVAAGVLVVIAVMSSWTVELLQASSLLSYWQGRYSLPLLIGLPVLLAWRPDRDGSSRDETQFDALGVVGGLALLNVAAWAASRRWGVGTAGSLLPWQWDTSLQPVPVLAVLLVLGCASAALAAVLIRPALAAGSARA